VSSRDEVLPEGTNMSERTGTEHRRLRAVLQVAESGVTLEHVATFPVATLPATATCSQATELMRTEGFDVIALDDEGDRYRYVELSDVQGREAAVADHAQTIDTRNLMPASLSLAEGLDALRRHPFFFLLRGRSLEGILTRADIQRPAVSMLTFALILAAEAGISELIQECCGDGWPQLLSDSRRSKALDVLEQRQQYNAELTLRDCLMLDDRLVVLQKSEAVRKRLGFDSGERVRVWSKELKRLRDTLAHGGSVLDHQPDPQAALDMIHEVRATAHRVWDAVGANSSE